LGQSAGLATAAIGFPCNSRCSTPRRKDSVFNLDWKWKFYGI
jgi:hypothetical protein